jgi:uncharacterized protein
MRGAKSRSTGSVATPVDVLGLARSGGCVEGELGADDLPRLADRLLGAARVEFRFCGAIDAQGRPSAELQLHGEVGLTCDRCGAPLRLPLAEVATYYFVDDAAELDALPIADELEDGSGPEPLVASPAFDLRALVEDELLLALPISPRHERCPDPVGEAAADPAAVRAEERAGEVADTQAGEAARRPLGELGALWSGRSGRTGPREGET